MNAELEKLAPAHVRVGPIRSQVEAHTERDDEMQTMESIITLL